MGEENRRELIYKLTALGRKGGKVGGDKVNMEDHRLPKTSRSRSAIFSPRNWIMAPEEDSSPCSVRMVLSSLAISPDLLSEVDVWAGATKGCDLWSSTGKGMLPSPSRAPSSSWSRVSNCWEGLEKKYIYVNNESQKQQQKRMPRGETHMIYSGKPLCDKRLKLGRLKGRRWGGRVGALR